MPENCLKLPEKGPISLHKKLWAFAHLTEALQSGCRVNLLVWSGEFRKIASEFLSKSLQRSFSGEFCLSDPWSQDRPKIHAQNSCPKSSAFLSNFRFQNISPRFFCLRWRPFFVLSVILIGKENSAQSFSDRSFWKSLRVVDVRAFGSWMSAPKCLFFQDFEFPDRSFGPGYPREWPPDVRGISVPKTSSLG